MLVHERALSRLATSVDRLPIRAYQGQGF
eukprot:COSAG01_NODE_32201_length_584_cov_16.723711_1_plen_28_part_10